jgi:FAD:protein FMN transferase
VITVFKERNMWRGINREAEPQLPSQDELSRAGKSVGFDLIRTDNKAKSIKLKEPDMILDLGGIAKGYAADEGLKVLNAFGISSAFVNGGGDISIGDPPPGRSGWVIAIPYLDPVSPDYLELNITGKAVTTSGHQYQFVEIEGIKYSHIINPFTGIGITDGSQVSVIAGNGMDADAFASALSVMEFDDAIEFVKNKPGLEALIQKVSSGDAQIWKSDGFNTYIKTE